MNEAIDAAIKKLAERIKEHIAPNEAMALSQAALNLAQARRVLSEVLGAK